MIYEYELAFRSPWRSPCASLTLPIGMRCGRALMLSTARSGCSKAALRSHAGRQHGSSGHHASCAHHASLRPSLAPSPRSLLTLYAPKGCGVEGLIIFGKRTSSDGHKRWGEYSFYVLEAWHGRVPPDPTAPRVWAAMALMLTQYSRRSPSCKEDFVNSWSDEAESG